MIKKKKRYNYYCSICNEGIEDGELYVKNLDAEYAHYDCLQNVNDVLDWFDCNVETMWNAEYEDYDKYTDEMK